MKQAEGFKVSIAIMAGGQNLASKIREYVHAMLQRVQGMKVLLLDQETMGIISMVYSQSDILKHEVFLVEKLDSEQTEKMRHLNAVLFIRPTDQNFLLLSKKLRTPCFKEYFIFFTNQVPKQRLANLAACDECEVVREVQEFYADVFVVNDDLFSLNISGGAKLTLDQARTKYEDIQFHRIVDGLASVCLAMQVCPQLRYAKSSNLTRQLAAELNQRIQQDPQFHEMPQRQQSVLLIVDRRSDPVTPCLNQWTYQGMVHELLGIENNRVDMRKAQSAKVEQKDIVLSQFQDSFFAENIVSNFGDLGMNVKVYLETFQYFLVLLYFVFLFFVVF